MKAPAPGHAALSIVLELVDMVRDRLSFRMFVEAHPQLRRLMERAEEVGRQSTRGVKAYDLKPRGEPTELVGFCGVCGTYHSQLVEVHP